MESKRTPRLNVIGTLLSSGRLVVAKWWHTVTGLWSFGFLMALFTRVEKPLVVILDKPSLHTAKSLQLHWELLKEEGLRFYFLPPYSPKLNRIEILWRTMTYEWLPFRSYSPLQLEQAIDAIGAGFGAEYKLTFCQALLQFNTNEAAPQTVEARMAEGRGGLRVLPGVG